MAIEVFNRYESKYLIGAQTFEKLERRLEGFMEPDAYNRDHETYPITNLYYDTPDSQLIRASLAKPRYKEKLRLRAYGMPDATSKVYVEIKKKFCGLTNKRRSTLALPEAYAFLSTGELPLLQDYMNPQVLREIQYILQTHEIQPAVYLAYDRRAYFGIGGHDLRLSFDRNIRSRRAGLGMELGDHGQPLIGQDQWLMEIKSAQSIPVWLTRLLSEFQVFPTSFSKYGKDYLNTLANGQRRMGPNPKSAQAKGAGRLVPATAQHAI